MNVIYEADAVVVGSGFEAVSCAKELGLTGANVLLIAAETFLGYEAGMHNRYFFSKEEQDALIELGCGAATQFGDYFCYIPDDLKLALEDLLSESNVKILYSSRFLNEYSHDGKSAVVIANKAGHQAVLCNKFINTENNDYDSNSGILYRYGDIINIPFDMSVKEKIENAFSDVKIYPGAFAGGHIVLENRFHTHNIAAGHGYKTRLQHATAESLLIACENVLNLTGFENAVFGKMSLKPMAEIPDIPLLINNGRLRAHDSGSIDEKRVIRENEKNKYSISRENKIYDYKYSKKIPDPYINGNDEKEYDVVIAGGGTSGVPAAIGASPGNIALLEMNPVLGGTATIGGVNAYWFGNRMEATEIIDNATAIWCKRLRTNYKGGWWSEHDVWNGDIKSFVMLDLCLKRGVDVYFDQVITGTVMEGDRIVGCVTIDAGKQNIFISKLLIDATGDGDVAAFAGAEYVYGSQKEGITLWSSLAQFTSPVSYSNNFSSTVYVGDPFDYTRFISLNRRTRKCYDHGAYVAPRESRHILGREVINLRDQLLGKTYPSYVHTCFSNYDPKGKSSSDIIYYGLLPPNLKIQIPLGALLPSGLRGIAIAGKAFSCDHDAFPPLRMQPDLQEIGYNLGKLSKFCVNKNIGFDELSCDDINQVLQHEKPVSLSVHDRPDPERDTCLINGDETFEWIDMDPRTAQTTVPGHVKACLKEEYLPFLKNAYLTAEGSRKRVLARLMLRHGCDDGSDLIINGILEDFTKHDGLAKRTGSISFCQLPPDHGVMPETVYDINLLANSKSPNVIKVFESLLEHLKQDKRDYHDIRSGIFSYIESFAFVMEKSQDPRLTGLIKEIMKFQEFESITAAAGGIMNERLLILYLSLAKSIRDQETLRRLADCSVTQISISAADFLRELTSDV